MIKYGRKHERCSCSKKRPEELLTELEPPKPKIDIKKYKYVETLDLRKKHGTRYTQDKTDRL